MGGAVAVLAAAKIPELTAAVSFYGLPPEQAVKATDIKIPLQGHFANKDDYITPKAVDDFEKALKAAGRDVEFFRYDADHAFVNEQRMAVSNSIVFPGGSVWLGIGSTRPSIARLLFRPLIDI
jgi:carboxymethylenebutenolidase